MRPAYRFCFMFTIAVSFALALSVHDVNAGTPAVGPHDVLFSEFRLSGPEGISDEYIEFYCNRDTDCDISNFIIQAFDPEFGDFAISFPDDVVIPARQYLLIGDGSEYSLPFYATLDFDVDSGFDFFIDNEGMQLISSDEETVIDSVGFAGGGNAANYVEGTGLQRATSRPANQYAYVRKRPLSTNGLPQDTDNNAADFVLISVTGTAHTGITAPPVLGAPGPQGLFSPPSYDNEQITGSLVEPNVAAGSSPNRVRVGSGNAGTLSVRRSFTNNTKDTFDYLSFRVIDLTTLNSPTAPGQAQLRLVTSGDAETFMNSQGRVVVIKGTLLEYDDGTEPNQPIGGGLNSTVAINLDKGQTIGPGETVDVQFLLNVVQSGTYRLFVFVEGFPGAAPPERGAGQVQPSIGEQRNRAAAPRVRARRMIVLRQRVKQAPIASPVLKKSKK
jgi:hypothetical protein